MSPKIMSPKKLCHQKLCHQKIMSPKIMSPKKLCHQKKKYLTYYYMLDHVIFLLLEAHGWLLGLLRRPTLRPVAVQDLGVPSEDEPGLEGSSIAQSFSF
jgi:hypothetical protein